MKKILIFVIVVGAVWFIWRNFFSSDEGAPESDAPAKVVEEFFNAFKAKDAQRMVACLGNSEGEPLGEFETEDNITQFGEFFKRKEFKLLSRTKVTIGESRINGNHAVVPVKYMDGSNDIPLAKSETDGKWRIDTGGNLLDMLLNLKYDVSLPDVSLPEINLNL